jgi:hypothetical protein
MISLQLRYLKSFMKFTNLIYNLLSQYLLYIDVLYLVEKFLLKFFAFINHYQVFYLYFHDSIIL